MHRITLYRTQTEWLALFTDPKVKEVMGTDLIPTAFLAAASSSRVLQAIRSLNPECRVELSREA